MSLLEKKIADHEKKIAGLETQVVHLQKTTGSYSSIRNRFLSTYKRDKLGTATDDDYKLIRAGSAWAHEGDAVRDAELYDVIGGRADTGVYRKLYGLDPVLLASQRTRPGLYSISHMEVRGAVARLLAHP